MIKDQKHYPLISYRYLINQSIFVSRDLNYIYTPKTVLKRGSLSTNYTPSKYYSNDVSAARVEVQNAECKKPKDGWRLRSKNI